MVTFTAGERCVRLAIDFAARAADSLSAGLWAGDTAGATPSGMATLATLATSADEARTRATLVT
ncbi:MAG: hypothetical protein ABI627_18420 [Polyangiaceae bacterium]